MTSVAREDRDSRLTHHDHRVRTGDQGRMKNYRRANRGWKSLGSKLASHRSAEEIFTRSVGHMQGGSVRRSGGM